MSSPNMRIDHISDADKFSSILTVDRINNHYDGKFKVMISNELGEAISTAQISVRRGKSI